MFTKSSLVTLCRTSRLPVGPMATFLRNDLAGTLTEQPKIATKRIGHRTSHIEFPDWHFESGVRSAF